VRSVQVSIKGDKVPLWCFKLSSPLVTFKWFNAFNCQVFLSFILNSQFWGLLGKEMSAGHIKKPIRLLLNVLRLEQTRYIQWRFLNCWAPRRVNVYCVLFIVSSAFNLNDITQNVWLYEESPERTLGYVEGFKKGIPIAFKTEYTLKFWESWNLMVLDYD